MDLKNRLNWFLALCLAPAFSAMGSDYFNGSLGVLSNQVSQGVGDVDGNRYNADLSFDYHKDVPDQVERRFTLNALINDQNKPMYSLNEAYLNYRWGRSDFYAGREILDWSDVDHTWGFGKVNNRQNFNFFDPGQEGLSGFLFKRRYSNGLRYRFFGSFLYVPEMNPGFEIDKKKGTITSSNPWAPAPAATTQINNEPVTIVYDVDMPDVKDVIFRWSGGLNMGWEHKNWEIDAYFLRKPENQISKTVDVNLDTISEPDVINAKVTPQFYYHDIYGGNLRWKNRDVSIYISGIAVRPNTFPDGNQQATQYTQIETEKRREDYVGGGISRLNDYYGMGLNYVARLSPFDRLTDNLAEDPRWNQALNAWGMYQLTRKLKIKADIKYDTLTTDRLSMLGVIYTPVKYLQMNAGMNMIGAPSNGQSFWARYRNNDAVYAGLRYVY